MKKILLLLILGCISIYGQNKDSLLLVIKKSKLRDTLQCNRLNTLIELENDEEIWMTYNKTIGQICTEKINSNISDSEKEKYYYYLGLFYNNVGFYYSAKSDFDQSLLNYRKAVIYFTKSKKLDTAATTYMNIGLNYIKKGQPQNFLVYHNKALKIYLKLKDSVGIANVYADIGYQYGENGSDSKALEYLIKSLKIADLLKDKAPKIRTLEYLVKTLKNQNENQKALEYTKQLISYFKEIGDEDSLSLNYFSIASTYNALGNFKQMFENATKSLVLAKKNEKINTIAANYGLLAKHYLNQKQIDDAYKYSKLEVEEREKNIKEPAYTKSQIRFSEILNLKKQNTEAEKIAKITFEKANELENCELIMMSARNLKTIYIATNQKVKALDFAQVEIKMTDSLSKINTKNSAIKNVFKYESEKKEAEITQLSQAKTITELENKRQKTTLLLLILGVVSALITSFLLFKRFKEKKQTELLKFEIEKTSAEKKASESELKALKSQMNPHFIFNALNSIQEQFMYGDKIIANEQMGNFTTLTREILTVSGKKKITIQKEIDLLTKYLELEKMRFDKDFSYQFIVSNQIDEDYHEIPPMILQPFVENSIKHGLLHQVGAKKISVYIDLDKMNENILCTIEDNGIGREKSAVIKTKNSHVSFSTNSIEQRLELLNDSKSDKKLVVYEDVLDENGVCVGTKVVLTIPIV